MHEIMMDDINMLEETGSVSDFARQLSQKHTVKGCEMSDAVPLSNWQKFVRIAVSSVLPGGHYQEVGKEGMDEVDASLTVTVVAANKKSVKAKPAVEYEIDNYIESYSCMPPTLFIPIVTVIELVIFIVYAVIDDEKVTATRGGAPHDSPLMFNPSRRYEAWRFITYMLLHSGYYHVIFNLMIQLLLGIPLEMVHKGIRVGTVYLLGVIAGSTVHAVFDRYTLLAGASGGVYALIGAHLAVVVMNFKEMQHDWMGSIARLISSAVFRLSIWGLLVIADVSVAVYERYFGGNDSNVGYAAHFGGLLAGFLIGVPVLRNLKSQPWEDVLWHICLIVYLSLMIVVVLFNCFYPDYPTTDWSKCCDDPIITKDKIDD